MHCFDRNMSQNPRTKIKISANLFSKVKMAFAGDGAGDLTPAYALA